MKRTELIVLICLHLDPLSLPSRSDLTEIWFFIRNQRRICCFKSTTDPEVEQNQGRKVSAHPGKLEIFKKKLQMQILWSLIYKKLLCTTKKNIGGTGREQLDVQNGRTHTSQQTSFFTPPKSFSLMSIHKCLNSGSDSTFTVNVGVFRAGYKANPHMHIYKLISFFFFCFPFYALHWQADARIQTFTTFFRLCQCSADFFFFFINETPGPGEILKLLCCTVIC